MGGSFCPLTPRSCSRPSDILSVRAVVKRGSYQLGNDRQKDDNCGAVAGKFGETSHETCNQHHSCSRRDLGQRLEAASDPDGQPGLLPNATGWRSGVKDRVTTTSNRTKPSRAGRWTNAGQEAESGISSSGSVHAQEGQTSQLGLGTLGSTCTRRRC